MIQLREVQVRVQSEAGPLEGRHVFRPGLNVICARNAFGKSLSVNAIPWCLGLEVLFGRPNNDSTFFPLAAHSRIDLPDGTAARVLSSEASILLERDDKARILLSRAIKGDTTTVRVEETNSGGVKTSSKLMARSQAMQDEHGGLQRFLFDWFRWPRQKVMTFKGTEVDVYAENLAPLFFIEQQHGWGDLQATQIGRYAQQQIAEVSVEYLLGALQAIRSRFEKNRLQSMESALRERARNISERIQSLFQKQGWAVEWSGDGSIRGIEAHWSSRSLMTAIVQDTKVDLAAERTRFTEQAASLRSELTKGRIDLSSVSAPAGASQRAIDLKQRRHELNTELHRLKGQLDQGREVAHSLEHRLQASEDVLRLVTSGVGRLAEVECPTCHRHLVPDDFALAAQSAESIEAHIAALKRDLELMSRNGTSLERALIKTHAEAERVDADLRDAERALQIVNEAVGPAREQIAAVAARLTTVERAIDRVAQTAADIQAFQGEVDHWLGEARGLRQVDTSTADLPKRVAAFTEALRNYLMAWGHSAINPDNSAELHLDERYDPYLGALRVKALGSASDGARLIAAYTLALAAASAQPSIRGLHPGFVILDEPLQQNPDKEHRKLFLAFLHKHLAQDAQFQTVIFTSLDESEIKSLQRQKITVSPLHAKHFLQPPSGTAGAEASPSGVSEK